MNTPDGKPYDREELAHLVAELYNTGRITRGEYDSLMYYLNQAEKA